MCMCVQKPKELIATGGGGVLLNTISYFAFLAVARGACALEALGMLPRVPAAVVVPAQTAVALIVADTAVLACVGLESKGRVANRIIS